MEMTEDQGEDFELHHLGPGIDLHLHDTDLFKTVRIDIFIQELLQSELNTRISLIGRLLERGTGRLPDLRSLNCFVEQLYGAVFFVDVDPIGDRQVIHLGLELVDERFLATREELMRPGMDLLHDVLRDPVCEDGGFCGDYLRQEKSALERSIAALFNDKMLYAQRRCIEEMCRGEPYGLSPWGNPGDFSGIDPVQLLKCHRELLACQPIDVFVCGREVGNRSLSLWEDFFDWERHFQPIAARESTRGGNGGKTRRLFEKQEVSQGRLILGYRTWTNLLDADYPALVLFNLLWGADQQSRLFRTLREEEGLCYHIASHLETMCGLLLVTAGITVADYDAVLTGIHAQLEAIRQGKLAENELVTARSLLNNRLLMLDDERGGLVDFHYRQRIAGGTGSRNRFARQLETVTLREVSQVACRLELDTVFFLHGA